MVYFPNRKMRANYRKLLTVVLLVGVVIYSTIHNKIHQQQNGDALVSEMADESQTTKLLISEQQINTDNLVDRGVSVNKDNSSHHLLDQERSAIVEQNNRTVLKTILMWTWLYSKADWEFGLGHQPFVEKCKGVTSCRTTLDQTEIGQADAVMFFIFAMTTLLNQSQTLAQVLPSRGKMGQIYVFWNDEPPRPAFGPFGTLKGLKGVFNLTVTYRHDSSIFLPIYRTIKMYQSKPPLNAAGIMAKKTKLACWVVSACEKSHSHRFEYAEKLAEHMEFDVYGKCGNHSCEGNGFSCFENLSPIYKFYFAFENSYCRDYITEKPYRTLKGDWVPVVLGGGNYSANLPPKSYIDVRDFASPRALAEYLLYLDQHDDKYMEYLEHKRYYRISRRQTQHAFCRLCDMLHQEDPDIWERDLDPHVWWEETGCIKKYYVPREIHLNGE